MQKVLIKPDTWIEKTNSNMRLIPAGVFQMGSEGWGEFESPIHEVYVDEFLIDEAPVTNQNFADFIKHYTCTMYLFFKRNL